MPQPVPLLNDPTITAAVGYIRVSTELQQDGNGLRRQAQAIRDFGLENGIKITRIYEDVRSGRDDAALAKPGGLSDAIREAKSRRIPLVVTDFSRIARSKKVGRLVARDSELRVITLKQGRVLDRVAIETEAAAAEETGKSISKGTRSAVEGARRSGQKPGNSSTLREAQRRGLISIVSQAEGRVEDLAELLAKEDPEGRFTRREVADLLNARGIRAPRGGSWNLQSITRPLRKARRLLAEEAAVEEAEEQAVMESLPDWGRF